MNDRTARDCVQRRKPWIYILHVYNVIRDTCVRAFTFLCACILCIYTYIHVYSVWIYAINIKVPYKTQSSAALLGRHTGGLWHAIASFKMQIRPCGVNHSGPNYSNYPPPIPPVHPFCSLLLRRALESSPGLLVCSPLRYIRAGEKKKKSKDSAKSVVAVADVADKRQAYAVRFPG